MKNYLLCCLWTSSRQLQHWIAKSKNLSISSGGTGLSSIIGLSSCWISVVGWYESSLLVPICLHYI